MNTVFDHFLQLIEIEELNSGYRHVSWSDILQLGKEAQKRAENEESELKEMASARNKNASKRPDALKWWTSLSPVTQTTILEYWQKMTTDGRKHWPATIISASDSTIERVYREYILGEHFDL